MLEVTQVGGEAVGEGHEASEASEEEEPRVIHVLSLEEAGAALAALGERVRRAMRDGDLTMEDLEWVFNASSSIFTPEYREVIRLLLKESRGQRLTAEESEWMQQRPLRHDPGLTINNLQDLERVERVLRHDLTVEDVLWLLEPPFIGSLPKEFFWLGVPLLPFLSSFMSKAGEDAYHALKAFFRRLTRKKTVVLEDLDTGLQIEVSVELPDEAFRLLLQINPAELPQPEEPTQEPLRWNSSAGGWTPPS